MIGLLLLPGRQLLRGLRHRVETARGVLLLHASQQVGGFAQAVGRAAGIGRAGTLRTSPPHVIDGLPQTVERLLRRLLPAVGRLLRLTAGASAGSVTGGRSTRLSAALALLALAPLTLALLALTLLALALLALALSLPAILRKLLLHLLLELFGFALQHFLLPFLFGRLLAVALLLG